MEAVDFKRKKGTTRELVSYAGVLTVMTRNLLPSELSPYDQARAEAKLQAIFGGTYDVPTGTEPKLRTGKALAAAVAQRSVERGVEGGGMFAVDGVGIIGWN